MTNPHDDDIEHIYLGDEGPAPASRTPHHTVEAVETKAEYKKFYRLILGILVFSTLLSIVRGWDLMRWIADFMAVFFIAFAAFKFHDIENFAAGYRQFDILSQKIRPWAYFYPFVEAFLGFWYLLSEAPIRLNIITMLIMGVAAYSIRKELEHKSRAHHISLGTLTRLPLLQVCYFEDRLMFGLAFLMIILNIVL